MLPRPSTALLAVLLLAGCIEPQPETPPQPTSLDSPTHEGASPGCYEAFQPGLDPASDLARLTAACASPQGLTPITPVHIGAPQTEETSEERLSFLGRAGRCYRIFAVGAPTVTDLDVALIDSDGRIAAADASADRWPIVPPRGPVCLHKDHLFTIHAAVVQGRGAYLMQVWSNPEAP